MVLSWAVYLVLCVLFSPIKFLGWASFSSVRLVFKCLGFVRSLADW